MLLCSTRLSFSKSEKAFTDNEVNVAKIIITVFEMRKKRLLKKVTSVLSLCYTGTESAANTPEFSNSDGFRSILFSLPEWVIIHGGF